MFYCEICNQNVSYEHMLYAHEPDYPDYSDDDCIDIDDYPNIEDMLEDKSEFGEGDKYTRKDNNNEIN